MELMATTRETSDRPRKAFIESARIRMEVWQLSRVISPLPPWDSSCGLPYNPRLFCTYPKSGVFRLCKPEIGSFENTWWFPRDSCLSLQPQVFLEACSVGTANCSDPLGVVYRNITEPDVNCNISASAFSCIQP